MDQNFQQTEAKHGSGSVEWPPGLEFRSLILGGGKKGRHHLEAKRGIAPQRFKIGCGLGSSQCDFSQA